VENKPATRQGDVQTAWTSRDFKKARRDLNLSVTELAKILNSNSRTVRLWEQEAENTYDRSPRPPNPIACRVLQWMLDGYRPPEWPEKLWHEEREKKQQGNEAHIKEKQ
jgi:DNA-binding XRE family transcriptional regulator